MDPVARKIVSIFEARPVLPQIEIEIERER